MVKRVAQFVWNSRIELFKYIIIGCFGVAIDILSLTFFKEYLGFTPVVAVVINQVGMIAYSFLLNKYWSFRNKEIAHKQLVKYLILTVWNYIFAVSAMYIFGHIFLYEYRLVRIGSIAVMTLWNFVLYKKWVYRTSEVRNQISDV